MKAKILGLLSIGVLSLTIWANPALAVASEITGSINVVGFFNCPGTCFGPGTTSIVSEFTAFDPESPAVAGGGFGDYAGSGGFVFPIGTVDLLAAPPGATPILTFADGTEFFASVIADIMRTPLACVDGDCSDSLEFSMGGYVSRPGFDQTPAVLSWSLRGSCVGGVVVGAGAACSESPTAGWRADLISPESLSVPEPGTLALLGLGLAGLGLSRRRKI